MATKIVSPKIELQVLRGLVSRDKKIAGLLMAGCSEDYFDSEQSKHIYKFIKSYMADTGEVPSFRNVIEDPEVDKSARMHFKDSVATITTEEEARATLKILNRYRQLRGIYDLGLEIQRKLDDGRIVMDEMLEDFSQRLATIRTNHANKNSFTNLGKNNSSLSAVRSLIHDEIADNIVPTGIKEYDDKNGGFLRGSLVTLAGSSGGGKSIVGSIQIAINMAERGFKVTVVPLEMSVDEMLARVIANIASLDSGKIIQRKLAEGEKQRAMEIYERWVRKVKKRGGRLSIFKPDGDVSIEDIFTALHTMDTDVILVDYISLLAGADGDDSWRQLGAIARKGKIHADATRRVVILLAQLSEDGKIRYSRAITEHSSVSWTWNTPLEEREKEVGRIRVDQPKARNGQSYPFEIGIKWANMKVVPVDQAGSDVGDVAKPADGDKKRKPMKNYASDL
jgi:replicative DNA helicase